jgi:hypothetical protein
VCHFLQCVVNKSWMLLNIFYSYPSTQASSCEKVYCHENSWRKGYEPITQICAFGLNIISRQITCQPLAARVGWYILKYDICVCFMEYITDSTNPNRKNYITKSSIDLWTMILLFLKKNKHCCWVYPFGSRCSIMEVGDRVQQ